MDILPTGRWRGNQHHQPSGSYLSGVYLLVGRTQVASPPAGGFHSAKHLKILLRILWGERGPGHSDSHLFLPCLCLPPLPWFEPAPWSSGKALEAAGSLFPGIKKRGTCPGAPQGPAEFQPPRLCALDFPVWRTTERRRHFLPTFLLH